MGRWQSGQSLQTVNLASSDFGGSNPSLPTKYSFRFAKSSDLALRRMTGRIPLPKVRKVLFFRDMDFFLFLG